MPVTTLLAHAALLARLAAARTRSPWGRRCSTRPSLAYFPIGTATDHGQPDDPGAGHGGVRLRRPGEGGRSGIRVGCGADLLRRAQRFNSLRFHRQLFQGNSVDEERYQIVPDSSRYREDGGPQDWAAPAGPAGRAGVPLLSPHRAAQGGRRPTRSPATSGPATTRCRCGCSAGGMRRCPSRLIGTPAVPDALRGARSPARCRWDGSGSREDDAAGLPGRRWRLPAANSAA